MFLMAITGDGNCDLHGFRGLQRLARPRRIVPGLMADTKPLDCLATMVWNRGSFWLSQKPAFSRRSESLAFWRVGLQASSDDLRQIA